MIHFRRHSHDFLCQSTTSFSKYKELYTTLEYYLFSFLYYICNISMQSFFECYCMSVSVTYCKNKFSLANTHVRLWGACLGVCWTFSPPIHSWMYFTYESVFQCLSLVIMYTVWQGVIQPPGLCAAVATFREDSLGHFKLLVPMAETEVWGFWIVNVGTLWQVLEIERKDTIVG